MKFEAPKMEVTMFKVEDILTSSGTVDTTAPISDGIGMDGGVCKGTMADYWQDNCPAY